MTLHKYVETGPKERCGMRKTCVSFLDFRQSELKLVDEHMN